MEAVATSTTRTRARRWPTASPCARVGTANPSGHAREHCRELVRDDFLEPRRNDTFASLTGHLLWREVDVDVVLELMLAWNRAHCRPPLPDDEVASVVQSIARVHERGSSASP